MVPHDTADPRTLDASATAFAGDDRSMVWVLRGRGASTLGLRQLRHPATAGAVAGEIANLPPAYALFVQGMPWCFVDSARVRHQPAPAVLAATARV